MLEDFELESDDLFGLQPERGLKKVAEVAGIGQSGSVEAAYAVKRRHYH